MKMRPGALRLEIKTLQIMRVGCPDCAFRDGKIRRRATRVRILTGRDSNRGRPISNCDGVGGRLGRAHCVVSRLGAGKNGSKVGRALRRLRDRSLGEKYFPGEEIPEHIFTCHISSMCYRSSSVGSSHTSSCSSVTKNRHPGGSPKNFAICGHHE